MILVELRDGPKALEKRELPDMLVKEFLEENSKRKREEKVRIEPTGRYKKIKLEVGNPVRTTWIGSELNHITELILMNFLRQNKDVFAWKASD